jgi:lysophospholipase L1-like esterase
MTGISRSAISRLGSSAVLAGAVVAIGLALSSAPRAQSSGEHWVGTWATSEVGRPQTPPARVQGPPPFMRNSCPAGPPAAATFPQFKNQTLRQIIHTSLAGSKIRVVLSNRFGEEPLAVGGASVALRAKDAAVQAASVRKLTFSGQSAHTIPPGAVAMSDPVDLAVPAASDLAVDIFLPGDTASLTHVTMHNTALQTNYVSQPGNHVGMADFPTADTVQNWFALARVDVMAPDGTIGLVTFGDSITDGTRSTPDTNNRWPDHLSRRFQAQANPIRAGIMNSGISGNRVLSDAAFQSGINAQARLDAAVLSQPGVTHVVFLEGINDIGGGRESASPTAEEVISAHKQIIERAHARGLKIYGATLTPFYGAAYYTEVGEKKRQAVNEWIRTSKMYDAVIDFDKVTRDPADPKKFLAMYDSCDHLHPSDVGYKAMADAIDLTLFRAASGGNRTASLR